MKILFITSGSIGDAIISTGILSHLMDCYPEAKFTIASGSAAVPLFEASPQAERVIALHKRSFSLHWLELWRQVRRDKWDMVIDLRSSLISYFLRTKTYYIFRKGDPLKSKSEQLAELMGLDRIPPTRLWSTGQAREKAASLLPSGRDIIVIAPKTNSVAKDWPIERFAELMRRIYDDKMLFVILATAAQKESIQPLANILPDGHVLDLSGQTDLQTAYAVIERAHLFIGNDSGLLHMAAAAGIKCVGLYGPSNDKMYAPRGSHVIIVKAYDFKMDEKEKKDAKYMQVISVDTVEEVLLQNFLK